MKKIIFILILITIFIYIINSNITKKIINEDFVCDNPLIEVYKGNITGYRHICLCPAGKIYNKELKICECIGGQIEINGQCTDCPYNGQIMINDSCECPKNYILVNEECIKSIDEDKNNKIATDLTEINQNINDNTAKLANINYDSTNKNAEVIKKDYEDSKLDLEQKKIKLEKTTRDITSKKLIISQLYKELNKYNIFLPTESPAKSTGKTSTGKTSTGKTSTSKTSTGKTSTSKTSTGKTSTKSTGKKTTNSSITEKFTTDDSTTDNSTTDNLTIPSPTTPSPTIDLSTLSLIEKKKILNLQKIAEEAVRDVKNATASITNLRQEYIEAERINKQIYTYFINSEKELIIAAEQKITLQKQIIEDENKLKHKEAAAVQKKKMEESGSELDRLLKKLENAGKESKQRITDIFTTKDGLKNNIIEGANAAKRGFQDAYDKCKNNNICNQGLSKIEEGGAAAWDTVSSGALAAWNSAPVQAVANAVEETGKAVVNKVADTGKEVVCGEKCIMKTCWRVC